MARGRIIATLTLLLPTGAWLVGCAPVHNQWVEDGPATIESWQSPTSTEILEKYQPARPRDRGWQPAEPAQESGVVAHGPLYFEDPFEDKGAGREGMNKYYIGWEDYLAMVYCYSRFTLNWLALPVSAAVTPPWSAMESDGVISRQALGYDHDATRAGSEEQVQADK